MTLLGRGLASLIPKLNKDKANEMLSRIDSLEFMEEEKMPEVTDASSRPQGHQKKVSVTEEFEGVSEEEEELPMPTKPFVTPLSFDEEPAAEAVASEVQEKAEETKDEEKKVSEVAPVVPEEPEASESLAEKAYEPTVASGSGSIWDKHEDQVQHISIGDIHINPLQPRRLFDPHEMEELTRSIEQHGILQPLVVHRIEGGYELVAGERRLRAAKSLSWDQVPCVVRRDVSSNQSRLVFALIENIQRENLNPIEEAMAYQQLNLEFGLTHEEIGQRVGRSRVGITNIVRILQLPAEIQRGLAENKISMGHARAILMIPDAEKQIRFYQHMLDESLTVRKAETRARRVQRSMKLHDPMRKKTHGRHFLALQYTPKLEQKFGHDAYIKFLEEKNRFEVTFRAYSEKEVHQLVGQLLGIIKDNTETDHDVIDQEEDEEG